MAKNPEPRLYQETARQRAERLAEELRDRASSEVMRVVGRPFSFMIAGGNDTGLPVGLTRYFNIYGSGGLAALNTADLRVPFDCVISELRCNAGAAPGAGETYTYALMVEAAASALTCQTVNPNLESQDLVNAVQVDEDDLIAIRIVTSAGCSVTVHRWSVKAVPIGD